MLKIILLLFISADIICKVESQTLPDNPCPHVFTYKTKETGQVYGEALIPYDGSNKLVFNISASFKTLFQGKKIKINLINPPRSTGSTEKLIYEIIFPFTNLIPKITQIILNDLVYCSGPPEPLLPGSGVTNLWATYFYEFYNGMSPNGFNFMKPPSPSRPMHLPATVTTDYEMQPYQPPPKSNNLPGKDSYESKDKPDNIADIIQSIFTSPKPENREGVITSSKLSASGQCGISTVLVPLVLGGTEVSKGQFPWLSALFGYNFSANSYDYKCTANLVSEKHVITAAGCIQYYKIQLIATEDILLVLGNNDLSHWATNGAVTRSAAKVMVHPDFKNNPNTANADMAVITLNQAVAYTKTIKPICLWENRDVSLDPLVNKQGLVAGWGKDEETSGLYVFKSKFVRIPIVSQVDCLKSSAKIANITSENTFCAGDLTGTGPCIGDGGAAFLIFRDGIYYLRGISSRTITKNNGCTLDENYAIFCDVAKYMHWVQECIKD